MKPWIVAAAGVAVSGVLAFTFVWFVVPGIPDRSTGYNLEDTLGRPLPASASDVKHKRIILTQLDSVVPYDTLIRAEMSRETYDEFLNEMITENRADGPVSEQEIRELEEAIARDAWKLESIGYVEPDPPGWWPDEFDPDIVRTTGTGKGAHTDLTYRYTSRYIDGKMYLSVNVSFDESVPLSDR